MANLKVTKIEDSVIVLCDVDGKSYNISNKENLVEFLVSVAASHRSSMNSLSITYARPNDSSDSVGYVEYIGDMDMSFLYSTNYLDRNCILYHPHDLVSYGPNGVLFESEPFTKLVEYNWELFKGCIVEVVRDDDPKAIAQDVGLMLCGIGGRIIDDDQAEVIMELVNDQKEVLQGIIEDDREDPEVIAISTEELKLLETIHI
jgi:hypothetical protein